MANFADIFRAYDEWDCPHTERHIGQLNRSSVNFISSDLRLPRDIDDHMLSKYTGQFVRDHKLGVTKTPIRIPFLAKLTAQDNKDSVAIFNNILRYMYELTLTEDKRQLIGSYVIQQALSHERLRDEIYIQLCNQTMGDARRADLQIERAWRLLTNCLSVCPPSMQLIKYLLKYVSDSRDSGGYGVVCQKKLLQCQEPRLCRVYPPTLLEREASKRKACMALGAAFADGEKAMTQIDSWTTGEEFASYLLSLRPVPESMTLGWAVTLRDDRDSFECSGCDYVLDLIGEMEVSPSFPCNSAYFLVMSDVSKPARQTYADQPHTADRLRLMPLEVDELPDSLIVPITAKYRPPPVVLPEEPVPVTPRPPTPISISPTVVPSPVRPPTPPTPVILDPDNVYASKNEALSQMSALNRRADPVPEELSRTSALNTRYTQAAEVNGDAKKYVRPTPVVIRPSSYVRNVVPPPQPKVVHQPPPPSRQVRQRDPLNKRGAVTLRQDGDNMDFFMDSLFLGIAPEEEVTDLNDSWAMEGKIKGGGDNLQQTPMPMFGMGGGVPTFPISPPAQFGFMPPPPPLLDPTSIQQQMYFQQMQQQQHTADLQTQLQTKQLENQVLQSTLQTELLKQQLHHVQSHSGQVRQSQIAPPPSADVSNTLPTPPVTNGNTLVQKKLPPPIVKPKTTTTTVVKKVQIEEPKGTSTLPAAPPLPPTNGLPPPPQEFNNDTGTKLSDNSKATVAVVALAKNGTEVIKATPAGRGTYRKPPSKIGQIKWPPSAEAEEEEAPGPKSAPGKLLIEEQTEPETKISPKQKPEEIQRKIAEKIKASQQQAANLQEQHRRKPPQPAVQPKRVSHQPVPHTPVASVVFAEVAPPGEKDDYDYTSTFDMKMRQRDLENKLIDLDWGTLKRKEPPPKRSIPVPPPIPEEDLERRSPSPVLFTQMTSPRNGKMEKAYDMEKIYDIHSMDYIHSVLHTQPTEPFLSYVRVAWKLDVKKEVFSPLENLDHPLLEQLVFAQIVHDVFSAECVRLGHNDRRSIHSILDDHGVHQRNVAANHRRDIKLKVIEAAKQTPFYFSRMFPVNGGSRQPNLHLVGVSHSGIRLITRCKDIYEDYFDLIEHISFEDLIDISVVKPSTVLMRLTKKYVVVYSYMAQHICSFIKTYQSESETLSHPKSERSFRSLEKSTF